MRTFTFSRRLRTIAATTVIGGILGVAVVPALADQLPSPPNPDPLPRAAFVARNDVAADALGIGPVAGALGGIVVTTPSSALSGSAQQALTEFSPSVVYIAGGTAAISPEVEAAIGALGSWDIERLAGADRDETAYLVGKVLQDLGVGRPVLTSEGEGNQVVGDVYVGGTLHADGIKLQNHDFAWASHDHDVSSVALNGLETAGEVVNLTTSYQTVVQDTISLPDPDCVGPLPPTYNVKIDASGTTTSVTANDRLVKVGLDTGDGPISETVRWQDHRGLATYESFATHHVAKLGPGDHTIKVVARSNGNSTLIDAASMQIEVLGWSCGLILIPAP